MAEALLKEKIHRILKSGYFNGPDDLVDVTDGSDDNIHLVIVSRKFDGLRMSVKDDLIWSELVGSLRPEEWGMVTLSIGASPEEFKAI